MIPLFIKSLKPKAAQTHTPTVKEKEPSPPIEEDAKKEKGEASGAVPGMEHFSHLLGMLSERKAGGDFGPHNVEAGHHVAFAAGKFTGAGKVTATGRDGLTVEDESRREHRVHWREVTGHFAPEKDEKPAADKPKKAKPSDDK